MLHGVPPGLAEWDLMIVTPRHKGVSENSVIRTRFIHHYESSSGIIRACRVVCGTFRIRFVSALDLYISASNE